jgi:hypothetical protein
MSWRDGDVAAQRNLHHFVGDFPIKNHLQHDLQLQCLLDARSIPRFRIMA